MSFYIIGDDIRGVHHDAAAAAGSCRTLGTDNEDGYTAAAGHTSSLGDGYAAAAAADQVADRSNSRRSLLGQLEPRDRDWCREKDSAGAAAEVRGSRSLQCMDFREQRQMTDDDDVADDDSEQVGEEEEGE